MTFKHFFGSCNFPFLVIFMSKIYIEAVHLVHSGISGAYFGHACLLCLYTR